MIVAEVLTPWAGDGLSPETAYHPLIMDDYPAICRTQDTTGQPSENLQPDPNLYVLKIWCEQATIDAIDADPIYEIIWSENE